MPWPRPWLHADLTDADVRGVLRRTVWLTVPEIAKRLHVTRHIYRTQIAKLLRQAVGREVEVRSRACFGRRGRGPLEYRRAT